MMCPTCVFVYWNPVLLSLQDWSPCVLAPFSEQIGLWIPSWLLPLLRVGSPSQILYTEWADDWQLRSAPDWTGGPDCSSSWSDDALIILISDKRPLLCRLWLQMALLASDGHTSMRICFIFITMGGSDAVTMRLFYACVHLSRSLSKLRCGRGGVVSLYHANIGVLILRWTLLCHWGICHDVSALCLAFLLFSWCFQTFALFWSVCLDATGFMPAPQLICLPVWNVSVWFWPSNASSPQPFDF